jgi:hypothetical protein
MQRDEKKEKNITSQRETGAYLGGGWGGGLQN